jgi:uncharacterized membrane protein YbhN (UPF0104 family)
VTQAGARSRAVRLLVGLAISLVFILATVSRVDLGEVAAALRRADFRGIALVVPIVFFELGLRSLRWQRLLAPMAKVPLTRAAAYLAIGYFANSMLPARLGDVARAYLAGQSFGVSRLGVLGTVVVERLADGLFILGVVAVLGVTVAGGGSLATTAGWLSLFAAVGVGGLVVAFVYLRSSREGRIRLRARSLIERVLVGATALRSPVGAAFVVGLTVAAFIPSVVTFSLIAGATGLQLTPLQCALVMGGLALSTSIPAAPGSLGTYEFVGLTILTTLGVDADLALAVVVLVHLVATLPLALTGLVAAWQLHFRVSEIAHDAEPAALAQDDVG